MSTDINLRRLVDRIKHDVCEDCEHKNGICKIGVCEDVVIEIGCFILYCAEKEEDKEE